MIKKIQNETGVKIQFKPGILLLNVVCCASHCGPKLYMTVFVP